MRKWKHAQLKVVVVVGERKDAQLEVVVVVGERKDAQLIVDRQLAQLTHGTDSPVARTQQVYYQCRNRYQEY